MSDAPVLSLPSVAVVIPTFRRPEVLKQCLDPILPYVRRHPECMIVVSDDGNAEETKAALSSESQEVKFVQGPQRGPAANRNWGASNSTGELLVFLDDDCRPDPRLIAEYQRAASLNPDIGVFEGRTSAEGEQVSFADYAPSNETGGYLWSCNFAIRRELFAGIGGFDERYPFAAMEDADLHFRVAAKSPIRFIPEARVFHGLERRVGQKGIRHFALSVLLYMHLHGLRKTGKSPAYFAHAIARQTLFGAKRILTRDAVKDVSHLFSTIWLSTQFLIIALFWKSHPYLARKFFPACCAGCRSVHATLAEEELKQ